MHEFLSSLAEAIKLRATTSIVGSYFIFWAVIHWQAIYTTLLVSEDEIANKFGMLKNEYINVYFIQPQANVFYWAGFLIPALGVFLWIWVLPNLLFLRSFSAERDYKFNKRKRVIQDRLDLKEIEDRTAKKAERIADKELATAKKELEATRIELNTAMVNLEKQKQELNTTDAKELSQERKYKSFMERPDAKAVLNDIEESIYGHYGYIEHTDYNDRVLYTLDPKSLSVAHTNELVDIDGNSISLTSLGKYFLSKN